MPYTIAVTVHLTEVYRRPPFPYDPVASTVRLAQDPIEDGVKRTIVGADGLRGARVTVAVVLAAEFEFSSVEKALRRPPRSVTSSPIARYVTPPVSVVANSKTTITALAFAQVHIVLEALVKENKELQGQKAFVIPPESPGESKVMTTICPLSENLDDSILGAGILLAVESNSMLALWLAY